MERQQGAKNNGYDGEALIGFALFFAVIVLFWFSFHTVLSRFLLKYVFVLNYAPAWLFMKAGFQTSWFMSLEQIVATDSWRAAEMKPLILFWIGQKGSLVLMPLIFIPLWFAFMAHSHPLKFMNRMHDYVDLMDIQSRTNSCIVPVVRFSRYWLLHKIKRPDVLFRALAPDEFAEKHKLIDRSGNELELAYERASEVFKKQIGGLINPKTMPKYKKALAVIFMTRIVYRGENGRRKGRALLDAISASCTPNKAYEGRVDFSKAFDFSCAKDFDTLFTHESIAELRKFFVHEKVFFMRLLALAREDGKLAPSDFIWLKLVDRDLWYALYGVSRTLIAKGYSEGAGPFGQYWAAQKAMESGQVLVLPYVEETLRAFERRLFEANMISERKLMTEREHKREAEFGRIPEI